MSSQMGHRASTYAETIANLKTETEGLIRKLKASDNWLEIEKNYRALLAIEEIAGIPKTTLEDLFTLADKSSNTTLTPEKKSDLALGDPQEPEAAAEIEKGS